MVCFVDADQLWNFALDGEQKWNNIDQLGKFCGDMSRDLQQTFKVWLVDYLKEFGVQMITLSFLLFLLCFILEMVGDHVQTTRPHPLWGVRTIAFLIGMNSVNGH